MPAKGFLLLIDPDNGRGLGINLFETEEDLRKGDEALSSMSPLGEGMGRRASVETYELAVDVRCVSSIGRYEARIFESRRRSFPACAKPP